MDTVQKQMPRELLLPAEFPDDRLARRPAWRIHHGIKARSAMPRLLLVPDASPVRGRRDESLVDCHPHCIGAGRKNCAARIVAWEDCRCAVRGLGRVDGVKRILILLDNSLKIAYI